MKAGSELSRVCVSCGREIDTAAGEALHYPCSWGCEEPLRALRESLLSRAYADTHGDQGEYHANCIKCSMARYARAVLAEIAEQFE